MLGTIQTATGNELGMPGWDKYLHNQRHDHNVAHISVTSFNPQRGAWTSGFNVTERQIRDLERIHKRRLKPTGSCVEIAENQYKLDKRGAKFGRQIMHASRVLSAETEHVWVSFNSGYVVIGVSQLDDGASNRCVNCVLAIQMHIMASAPLPTKVGGKSGVDGKTSDSLSSAANGIHSLVEMEEVMVDMPNSRRHLNKSHSARDIFTENPLAMGTHRVIERLGITIHRARSIKIVNSTALYDHYAFTDLYIPHTSILRVPHHR